MRAHDYSPGERVELVTTTKPNTRLRPGARGTVLSVDALGTVYVAWDDDPLIGLVPGGDVIQHVRATYDDGCALCRRAARA